MVDGGREKWVEWCEEVRKSEETGGEEGIKGAVSVEVETSYPPSGQQSTFHSPQAR